MFVLFNVSMSHFYITSFCILGHVSFRYKDIQIYKTYKVRPLSVDVSSSNMAFLQIFVYHYRLSWLKSNFRSHLEQLYLRNKEHDVVQLFSPQHLFFDTCILL